MAVAEKELLVGVVLEVVIAANVDHRRASSLCCSKPFAPMREELRTQFQPLVEFPLHQPSGIREISIVGLRDHLVAAASINEPLAVVLLQPDGKFVPDFPYAESLVRASSRQFKHGEGPDLRDVLGLLDD